MTITDRAMDAMEFICDHLGEFVYIVDSMDCDECLDMGKEQCPLCQQGNGVVMERVADCRKRRTLVRRVDMHHVDIRLDATEAYVEVVINDCYGYAPGEIFTTQEAATAHMESLPANILKFYPQEG